MIENENITIDGETGQVINNKPNKKDKKHRPVLLVILCLLVSLAGGFAGGYIATKNTTQTVIYKNESTNTNASFDDPASLQNIIASVKDSVVEINTEVITESSNYFSFFGFPSQQIIEEGAGSGIIISEDGYIITNHHVIDGARNVKIYLTNDEEYEAKIVGSDEKSDIAVLKIEASGLPYAAFADSDAIEVGDDAIAIGNPLGSGISVTTGIISAVHREIVIDNEAMNLLQTNAQINSGNSGGGLFNISGQLIGIVNAKTSSSSSGISVEGLGYAIPSNTALRIANAIIEDGYVKDRPTLGVTVTQVTEGMQGFEPGLYVTEIQEDSPASKAGLQTYDRIIRFNGVDIESYTTLSAELNNLSVGDTVDITVIRNNEEVTLKITLGEASQSATQQ